MNSLFPYHLTGRVKYGPLVFFVAVNAAALAAYTAAVTVTLKVLL